MLKDRVIKPLLVATEKVVEYYFPEEEKEGQPYATNPSAQMHEIQMGDANSKKQTANTPTVNDDQTSVSS